MKPVPQKVEGAGFFVQILFFTFAVMNAVVTIRQTFDLETRGEAVCRVEAGTDFGATAEKGRVWFWVTDESGRLHKATLPIDSELIKVKMNNSI